MAIFDVKKLKGKYELVVGLEIHVELRTQSKMFCECDAWHFGVDANTHVCPVCLGLPGALPIPNKKALEWTILIANSLNCEINTYQQFDRKHYFYPDLPKGYQITQFYFPAGEHGYLEIDGKKYRIRRVHLEEDTGKLVHEGGVSLVDFNRSGVPLVEIVTEPDFKTPEEAKKFLKMLHLIVRYLGVSDADLEKGSMRLEPNISVKPKGSTGLPKYKVEVKNINSFNFVAKAIEYEFVRQAKLLEQGIIPDQETRGFDPASGKTKPQRKKEVATDYRYLPDPDIPPVKYTEKEIEKIIETRPELPHERYNRYIELGIRPDVAEFLMFNYKIANEFDNLISKYKDIDVKGFAVYIANRPEQERQKPLTELLEEFKASKQKESLDKETIAKVVAEVISENPKAVEDYKAGKQNAIQFLLGQFMRKIKKRIDVKPVLEEIKRQIEG